MSSSGNGLPELEHTAQNAYSPKYYLNRESERVARLARLREGANRVVDHLES